jgi:hypothetical protein
VVDKDTRAGVYMYPIGALNPELHLRRLVADGTVHLDRAVEEFCANTGNVAPAPFKKATVVKAIGLLEGHLTSSALTLASVPAIEALTRLAQSETGFHQVVTHDSLLAALRPALTCNIPRVTSAVLELYAALCSRPDDQHGFDEATERSNKLAVLPAHALGNMAALIKECAKVDSSSLLALSLVRFLRAFVLEPHSVTTDPMILGGLLDVLAGRVDTMVALFRSPCQSIAEGMALFTCVMMKNCPKTVLRKVQHAAMTEGLVLHHFRQAVFDGHVERRAISQYLVGLLGAGSEEVRG